MKITYFVSFVFSLLLLTIKATSHSVLHRVIFNTTKSDNQEFENIAQGSLNYSLGSDNGRQILKVIGTKETSTTTRALPQDGKQNLAPEEFSDFTSKFKVKYRENVTGLIDVENGNTDDTDLYDDDVVLRVNMGKSFGKKSRSDGFVPTAPKDNPYAVMLVEFLDDHAYFGICSGSLVSLEWVLTSASHCFTLADIPEIEIHAGGYSKQEWSDQKFRRGHQMILAEDYFVHPSYEERERFVDYYDVALVKAKSRFKSTRSVSVVKISSKPWTHKRYKRCKATGFGKVQFFEKHPGEDFVRRTHDLVVKSPCPCLETEKDPGTWICAKPRDGVGICGSDWGAALVCDGLLTAVATEVIAFDDFHSCVLEKKPYCAKDNTLSVFQNIHPCLDWIKKHVDVVKAKSGSTRLNFSLVVVFSCTMLTKLKGSCLTFI